MTGKYSCCSDAGGQIVVVHLGDHVFITAQPARDASAFNVRQWLKNIADVVAESGAVPIHERLFGSEVVLSLVKEARRDAFLKAGLDPAGPITLVGGQPPWGYGLAGIMIHCVRQQEACTPPAIVHHRETAVGMQWQTRRAEYLVLQDLGADADPDDAPIDQAKHVFQSMHRLVSELGFSLPDMVRTWFYLNNIPQWYGDFNLVRRAAYTEFGIMPQPGENLLLPSSTGIGCQNIAGRAIIADLLLIRMKNGVKPNRISNPTQKEAFQYGAAFSRAVEIEEDGMSLVEISGTAAIDEYGRSRFPSDARSQIECTLDKMEALLARVGGTIHDIASATVFVKRPEIAATFLQVGKDRGMKDFPAIMVCADICRDELLFEIDAEALVPRSKP